MIVQIDSKLEKHLKELEVSQLEFAKPRWIDGVAWTYSNIGNDSTRMSSVVIRKVCGHHDNILKWLVENDLIEKTANYSTSSKVCNSYRRTSESPVVRWVIKNKTIIKHITNWEQDHIKNSCQKDGINSKGLVWMIETLMEVQPTLDLWHQSKEDTGSTLAKVLNRDKPRWTVSNSGRMWHDYTQLNQEQRSQLLIGNELPSEIDISASHLCSLAAHFGRGAEAEKLFRMVREGDFYGRLQESFLKDAKHVTAYNAKHKEDEQIKTVKGWVIRCINNYPMPELATYRQLVEMLPNSMEHAARYRYKCKGGNGNKRFATKIQHYEAAVLADIAAACKDKGTPCFGVYDSVIVPRSQQHVTEGIIEEVMFKHWGNIGLHKEKSIRLVA